MYFVIIDKIFLTSQYWSVGRKRLRGFYSLLCGLQAKICAQRLHIHDTPNVPWGDRREKAVPWAKSLGKEKIFSYHCNTVLLLDFDEGNDKRGETTNKTFISGFIKLPKSCFLKVFFFFIFNSRGVILEHQSTACRA